MLCLCFTASYNQTISEGSEIIVFCENEGRVSWSKLADGKRERIATVYQNGNVHMYKPDLRYSLSSNLSLVINEAYVSDSGLYYCDASAVMNLTVTPLKGGLRTIASLVLMFLLNIA